MIGVSARCLVSTALFFFWLLPMYAMAEVIEGKLNFRIEVGVLNIVNTYNKPEFTRVNFTQVFETPPVVFTLPTIDGSNSAAHRVRNIDTEGFDIMTLEPDGEDGPHVAMALNYLAVEKGVHDLPGERKLIVDTIDATRAQAYAGAGGGIGWHDISFGGHFKEVPAVLGQIQTMNNELETKIPAKPSRPWLTTAISRVSSSGMKLALERSESSSGSINTAETVGYFAVEPVTRIRFPDSRSNIVEMEVIRSEELLQGWGTCKANRVDFSLPWSRAPVVLATKNTRDGDSGVGDGDGGWLRRCGTTTTYTELQVDEVRMNKIGDGNRKHDVRERAGLVMFSGNFVMVARQLDHFRMYHDGLGVAGLAENITVVACRDADCNELYTDTVTVTFEPGNNSTSWSGDRVLGNQLTFAGGKAAVVLNRNAGGQVAIGLTSTPTPENPTRCFAGAVETCDMTFATTDFVVALPDQVSARSAQGKLSLPTCWSDFQSTEVEVEAYVQYTDPVWVGPAVTVNGSVLPVDGSAGKLKLVFDDSCVAPLKVDYADVGEIALRIRFVGSGDLDGLTIAGADDLVFYPDALELVLANGEGTVLSAADAAASPVHPAGAAFAFSVRAVNAAGAVVGGYAPQGADRLRLHVQRVAPAGGFDGVLTLAGTSDIVSQASPPAGIGDYAQTAISPAAFSGGRLPNLPASYSEVGLLRLYLADSDYMGHPLAALPVPAGRFVPAGFEAIGSLGNRSATAGCAGAAFTYMDEPMRASVQLVALNAAGAIARNYQGDYARLDAGGITAYAGTVGRTLTLRDGSTDLSSRLNIRSTSIGVPWSGGIATLDLEVSLDRAALPDGPYESAGLGLMLSDADGVPLQGLDTDIDADGDFDVVNLGTTRLVHGRLSVGNAHGSELRGLAVPLAMHYYAGATRGFVVHADDSCTSIDGLTLTDVDVNDGLADGETCIVDDAAASGADACVPGTAGTQFSATAAGGLFDLQLRAPGSGNTGSTRVSADVADWARFDWTGLGLGNPSAVATFGIYSRDIGVIYQRDAR